MVMKGTLLFCTEIDVSLQLSDNNYTEINQAAHFRPVAFVKQRAAFFLSGQYWCVGVCVCMYACTHVGVVFY